MTRRDGVEGEGEGYRVTVCCPDESMQVRTATARLGALQLARKAAHGLYGQRALVECIVCSWVVSQALHVVFSVFIVRERCLLAVCCSQWRRTVMPGVQRLWGPVCADRKRPYLALPACKWPGCETAKAFRWHGHSRFRTLSHDVTSPWTDA